jgi:hypothetical protein
MLCDECVIDEGDGFRGDLVIVLVVLVGLGRRRARRCTRGVSPIARSISAISQLPCRSLRAQAVWMPARVRDLSSSRSSMILM